MRSNLHIDKKHKTISGLRMCPFLKYVHLFFGEILENVSLATTMTLLAKLTNYLLWMKKRTESRFAVKASLNKNAFQ